MIEKIRTKFEFLRQIKSGQGRVLESYALAGNKDPKHIDTGLIALLKDQPYIKLSSLFLRILLLQLQKLSIFFFKKKKIIVKDINKIGQIKVLKNIKHFVL